MIRRLNLYIFVIILSLLLLSCNLNKKPELITPSIPSVLSESNPIEYQDQISQLSLYTHHYNWNSAMQLIVNKMLQINGIDDGSVLLIDDINDRTNGLLNAREATETLRNLLGNNNRFSLISSHQLSIAKRRLGLLPQDSFYSRSKIIGIARNVGAQYVLYSSATGNVNSPSLQVQLMLVQTGELIWSWESLVTQL